MCRWLNWFPAFQNQVKATSADCCKCIENTCLGRSSAGGSSEACKNKAQEKKTLQLHGWKEWYLNIVEKGAYKTEKERKKVKFTEWFSQ